MKSQRALYLPMSRGKRRSAALASDDYVGRHQRSSNSHGSIQRFSLLKIRDAASGNEHDGLSSRDGLALELPGAPGIELGAFPPIITCRNKLRAATATFDISYNVVPLPITRHWMNVYFIVGQAYCRVSGLHLTPLSLGAFLEEPWSN
jgi:hypothetical protein